MRWATRTREPPMRRPRSKMRLDLMQAALVEGLAPVEIPARAEALAQEEAWGRVDVRARAEHLARAEQPARAGHRAPAECRARAAGLAQVEDPARAGTLAREEIPARAEALAREEIPARVEPRAPAEVLAPVETPARAETLALEESLQLEQAERLGRAGAPAPEQPRQRLAPRAVHVTWVARERSTMDRRCRCLRRLRRRGLCDVAGGELRSSRCVFDIGQASMMPPTRS